MNRPESMNMKHADLLVEIGCEELPPKSLPVLGNTLFESFSAQLEKAGLAFDQTSSRVFYTPRRLALSFSSVASAQADQVLERKGPAVIAAFDQEGQPTQAATGFARSVGKSVSELATLKTDKGEWLYCCIEKPGASLAELLFPMLEQALASLPIAKPMRWGANDFSFIRPVHWLVAIHGSDIIPGSLFGLKAGNTTRGHRIHSAGPHIIDAASNYEKILNQACVMVDQHKRQELIEQQARELGKSTGGEAVIQAKLLEEVTNLVEWPRALMGDFDEEFLQVPAEALIASMQDHQKFFPVIDPKTRSLLARFITIANLDSTDFDAVRAGFERVIRPRLADARFFWDQDNLSTLEDWLPRLDGIVFQNKLGSIGDKSKRIATLSQQLAEVTGVNTEFARRAGLLCKCDLVSHMVGEFPELQGTMGQYYATQKGEDSIVAEAIGDHYLPTFSGDRLPSRAVGKVVALADKLDSLTGIFAAGLKPTGNKDPFALRRAALGLTRILLDGELLIELDKALLLSASNLEQQLPVSDETRIELRQFILDRLKNFLREQGNDTRMVNAVMDAPLSTFPDLASRLEALKAFMSLEVSDNLAAANKRIGNILRKSKTDPGGKIEEDRLVIEEERQLFKEVSGISEKLEALYADADYASALALLAGLSTSIDAFFDQVMVMDENLDVRENRLNLLQKLKGMFDRVANLALIG